MRPTMEGGGGGEEVGGGEGRGVVGQETFHRRLSSRPQNPDANFKTARNRAVDTCGWEVWGCGGSV